jgi:hypothetical protein
MDLQGVEWEGGGDGLDLCGLGEEQVMGSCNRGNESSGSIKCGNFFD